jgi:DNA polymerase I-like protein with 3'-5' exonuclease and polymerase domains
LKILFLQEFLRENHVKMDAQRNIKNTFFQTEAGKMLRGMVEDKSGLGLTRKDYYIDYTYYEIPEVAERDRRERAIKYTPPSIKQATPHFEFLYDRVVEQKPDLIIPMGNLGCKALLGRSKIKELRGVPEKVTITSKQQATTPLNTTIEEVQGTIERVNAQLEVVEAELASFQAAYKDRKMTKDLQQDYDNIGGKLRALKDQKTKAENELHQLETGEQLNTHTCWVLPTFSMEHLLAQRSVEPMVVADFTTIAKFIVKGDEAFDANLGDYEFVDTIERVREIFTKEIKEAPIVSWDLETNTLQPAKKGAKPLVISLAWREGEGVTIPLEHKDFTWHMGYLAEIYNYIRDFVADPNIIKVGHNLQYDIRFLRLTKGFTEFHNHRDTKIMYYALLNQDVDKSLRLTNLSYELTDMGGYDKALEDYKQQYIDEWVEERKAQKKEMQEAFKRAKAEEKALAKAEKRKPRALPTPEFPDTSPPVNEIDGSNFNYEWIPLVKMLHPYASGDVDACLRIHNKLDAIGLKPENARIRELYTKHYTDLTARLAEIEANGVKMNTDYTKGLIEAYTGEEDRILQEIRQIPEVKQLEAEKQELYQMAIEDFMKPPKERDPMLVKLRTKYRKDGTDFNPNSSEDKQKALFKYTGIKLPYNKEFIVESAFNSKIPEEEVQWFHYKTDKGALNYIKDNVPEHAQLADMLLTHSLVKTRKQNFTYKLLGLVDDEGLIHGGFNPTGTETSIGVAV